MTRTLKARIVNGRVELSSPIDIPNGTEVEIRYESITAVGEPARAYRGILKQFGAPFSTDEDWDEAKKMWEPREP